MEIFGVKLCKTQRHIESTYPQIAFDIGVFFISIAKEKAKSEVIPIISSELQLFQKSFDLMTDSGQKMPLQRSRFEHTWLLGRVNYHDWLMVTGT